MRTKFVVAVHTSGASEHVYICHCHERAEGRANFTMNHCMFLFGQTQKFLFFGGFHLFDFSFNMRGIRSMALLCIVFDIHKQDKRKDSENLQTIDSTTGEEEGDQQPRRKEQNKHQQDSHSHCVQ